MLQTTTTCHRKIPAASVGVWCPPHTHDPHTHARTHTRSTRTKHHKPHSKHIHTHTHTHTKHTAHSTQHNAHKPHKPHTMHAKHTKQLAPTTPVEQTQEAHTRTTLEVYKAKQKRVHALGLVSVSPKRLVVERVSTSSDDDVGCMASIELYLTCPLLLLLMMMTMMMMMMSRRHRRRRRRRRRRCCCCFLFFVSCFLFLVFVSWFLFLVLLLLLFLVSCFLFVVCCCCCCCCCCCFLFLVSCCCCCCCCFSRVGAALAASLCGASRGCVCCELPVSKSLPRSFVVPTSISFQVNNKTNEMKMFLATTLLASAAASAVAAGACADAPTQGTRFVDSSPLSEQELHNEDACCAACADNTECKAWTFEKAELLRSARCFLHGSDTLPTDSSSGASCATHSPQPPHPPSPGPTPSGKGQNWVVIAAGSKTYGNYRHQADACHAYQVRAVALFLCPWCCFRAVVLVRAE